MKSTCFLKVAESRPLFDPVLKRSWMDVTVLISGDVLQQLPENETQKHWTERENLYKSNPQQIFLVYIAVEHLVALL